MTHVPTEAFEHSELVAYLRRKGYRFHHSANETTGGHSGRMLAYRNKRNGTSKGFPDFLIIANNRVFAIELKRLAGSTVAPEQREWIHAFVNAGVVSTIAKGHRAAEEWLESQLSGSPEVGRVA